MQFVCFLTFLWRYLISSFVFWAFLGQTPLGASGSRSGVLPHILHRTVPTANSYAVQNVSSAKVEKPCSKMTDFSLDHSSRRAASRGWPLLVESNNVSDSAGHTGLLGSVQSPPAFHPFTAGLCREGLFLSLALSSSCMVPWSWKPPLSWKMEAWARYSCDHCV